MKRYLVVACLLAIFATQLPSAARASTVQYDLTLTPTFGSIGGSGYFDVSTPVNGAGTNTITNFFLAIDGQDFTLGNAIGVATATFAGGALSSLNYLGSLVSETGGWNLDILGTGGLSYAFLDIGTGAAIASGTINAVDAPAATPLPSAGVLFATGLLGLLFLNYRRKHIARLTA